MTVDFRQLLGEDHLVWTVLDVVDQLDLGELYARYGAHEYGGRPAYDPAMMLALVIYAYAEGTRGSRSIERACRESLPYRAITANLEPDHATIARFRAAIDDLLPVLFAKALAICFAAGLDRVGVVAVDGTKMLAAASKQANADIERLKALEAEAAEMVAEAELIDSSEDNEAPSGRQQSERERRLERIRAAKARIDEAQATHAARRAAKGHPPTPPGPGRTRANTTDPDSRLMKGAEGFVQGYNAQAVVDADQLVLAAEVTTEANDSLQFIPMIDQMQANLKVAGITSLPTTALADAGYWSADNATHEADVDVLIATRRPPTALAPEQRRRRDEIVASAAAGEISRTEAAERLGITTQRLSLLISEHRRLRGAPSPAEIREAMEAKLADPANRQIFNQRSWIIEGLFGQTKEDRNCRRFLRRGLKACDAEWKLIHLAGNIRKAWRKRLLAPPDGPSRSCGSHSRPSSALCRHHRRHSAT